MNVLDSYGEIADKIKARFKNRRLQLNITQSELSRQSGVSLGSVKRFENQGLISLENLLKLALVMESTKEFYELFPSAPSSFNNLQEIIALQKTRKRARK